MFEEYIKKIYLSYGEIAGKIAPNFRYITEDLKKSGMRYTLEEYLSLAIFISLIVFVVEIPILTLILSFFIPVILALFFSFVFSAAGAIVIFFLFTTYPKAQVSNLASKIDKGLPFSVSYMVASASSDAPPIEIFKSLSKIDEYPELKEQALNVVRDVEGMGMDLLTALRRESKRTPSKEFRRLLHGMESTISSGGDLTAYLNGKAISLFKMYQNRIRVHADLLSMLTEIYITIMILGPILFTVLTSLLASMSGGSSILAMQALISFILMPLISVVFTFYINLTSP
jgi:flagellar protein FlaJ